ncbi:6266_t:CDS:2 [Diversispora eburnea]|uniref:6266_t:CDS:1 n=1 Tax=Diversispora eburnea TaxID=1213867 RepID=A0A9N9FJW5_9GLOM|nr:6266_t:CDS:2 [Diversispora eburnea]
MVGYPQIVKGNPDIYYNSICFIGRDGKLIETYSKHFLYTTDEIWANEGPEFKVINVDSLGKVGFGICMDLNPYQFKAPFDAYEFANFHLQQKVKILLYNNYNNMGNILVVVCNRTGIEDSTTFAGSSSILSISPSTSSIHLLGSLGKRQESVMIIDVPIDDVDGVDGVDTNDLISLTSHYSPALTLISRTTSFYR